MRLVTDLHETLYRWAEWADTAVNALEKADLRAIQRQTQDVLQAISASRAVSASSNAIQIRNRLRVSELQPMKCGRLTRFRLCPCI
jgi:hypothetical protein